ncbi:MAG TPA: cytochrome C oxidase subunit I [Actinobacteria bacterium]|nr:cytochrome C oxidase subunit I [Actinomycetota bacterium]
MTLTSERAEYRVCPVTQFKVDLQSEALIKVNAVAAVVALTIGGIAAILIALTRWEAVGLLPPEWFYRLLTVHGTNMLIFWIVFFEMAGLYFGATILLDARLPKPAVGWLAFGLMVVGALFVEITALTGNSTVMFTAYEPLGSNEASPLFYLGLILFAVGALVAVGLFFATVVMARVEKTYEGSLPLVTYGLVVAAIIATYTLLSGAVALVPPFLRTIGIIEHVDPAFYRNFFWSFGHPAQQINLAAMVAIWYAMGVMTVGGSPVSEKLSRFAFILYVLFINLGSAHHLLVDPGLSFGFKTFNTSYGMYLAVLGSMIHAFSIPAMLEVAQRRRGFTNGLFEWLRKLPWREPGFAALAVSMFVFGWIGGVTGVTMGTEQIDMVAHNTLRVPGHFHAAVVGGTTLAFMGFTYYVIPLVFRKRVKFLKLATWQPYLFGLGISLVAVGMITAGIQGVPRRTADIDVVREVPGTVHLSLAVVGIGALIAFTALCMYLAVVLASVFTGPRVEATSLALVQPMEPVPAAAEGSHVAPKGTFVIVLVFLAFFAAFYLANWWMLGRTWFVS